MLFYMKQILIELDDRCARDLERVAPAKNRRRAEFVRLAIRRAIDLALDRATEEAYRARPLPGELAPTDRSGWDEHNRLAKAHANPRGRRGSTKSAA
jgi:predicted transcriptional regulator